MSEMSGFNYNAPAELFPRRNKARPKRPVAYRRFTTAAEAIRFAIEKLPAEHLAGAVLEVNEERFDSDGIRQLYESAEYPFRRQVGTVRESN